MYIMKLEIKLTGSELFKSVSWLKSNKNNLHCNFHHYVNRVVIIHVVIQKSSPSYRLLYREIEMRQNA